MVAMDQRVHSVLNVLAQPIYTIILVSKIVQQDIMLLIINVRNVILHVKLVMDKELHHVLHAQIIMFLLLIINA